MSFDIFFQPCRFNGPPVAKKNPFTGKVQHTTTNEPLTDRELAAVRAVLGKLSDGPKDDGVYGFSLGDGGDGEVFGEELATGCMVAVRSLTPDVHRLLFELLTAGNWVMLPAMEDTCAVTTSPESMKGVPDDFPEVAVCRSPEEIGALLTNGYQAWVKYKGQVTGGDK